MNMEQDYRLAIDDEEYSYPIGFEDEPEGDEEELWDDPFDEDDTEDNGPFYDPQGGGYW